MQHKASTRPILHWIGLALGMAVVYSVVGALSFWLATPPGYSTLLWPSSGIALAGALIFGARIYPGIFLGSWLITLWITLNVNPEAALLTSMARLLPVGAGAVVQAWVGSVLIRRYVGFPVPLNQGQKVSLFLVLGGPMSCLINATVATITMWSNYEIPFELRFTNWWSWWLGDTVGVWFIVPFVLISMTGSHQLWQKQWRSVVMPLALACVVVVFVSMYTRIWRHERLVHTFASQAQDVAQSLEKSFDAHLEAVHTIERLFISVPAVDRSMFRTFVQAALAQQPGIQALKWVPRVPHAERSAYETRAQHSGFPAFHIRERRASGELVPAADQAEYFPVYYVEPYADNESALGFNLASETLRLAALQKSRDSGNPVTTAPITLTQESGRQWGSLIFVPIYQQPQPKTVAERRRLLRGFALGVFRIGNLVQASLRHFEQSDFSFQLYDKRPGAEPQLLVGDPEANPANIATLQWRTTLSLGDHPWLLVLTATPTFIAKHQPWYAVVALDLTLLLTAILIGTLLVLTGRTETLAQTNTDLAREIRDRQDTEAALVQSESKYRLLVESSPYCIHQIDPNGHFSSMNKAGLQMMGVSEEREIIGLPYLDAVSVADRDRIERLMQAAYQGETLEFEFELPSGRIMQSSFIPLAAMGSEQPHLMGLSQDITARKQLEVQLRQSQKMEAVGTLAAGIAHDFNNVLGAIFIHTEVAKMQLPPDSTIQDNLRDVLLAAGRAKDLVQQILTFSRQAETQRQPIRLTSVVQDTLALLRATLPATIEIQNRFPEMGDMILADLTQMHQIVLNLSVNAEHAMRRSGGTLGVYIDIVDIDSVSAESLPELSPGPYVCLTIRDSGDGMTPDVMHRMFDPFFTTKQTGEGTGMGLAMVDGLVASHHGAICVESLPDEGTTFTLYFPQLQEPVAESASAQDDGRARCS